jgi:DNA mismatch endonuclease (patch repair protein)
MADIVDKRTRSRMMSGIKGKNTKPELVIRKALFAKGFRYRLHDKRLQGKPDLVFPKYKAVIFVHGCFWHGHDCHLFKWPTSNTEFWRTKINRNKEVDTRNRSGLLDDGWRVLEVWECALKGSKKLEFEHLLNLITSWLQSGTTRFSVISGEGQPR